MSRVVNFARRATTATARRARALQTRSRWDDYAPVQPSDVTGAFLGAPYRRHAGWTSTTNATALRPTIAGETYYVDVMLGDDGNAGTAVAPFKTIKQAYAQSDFGTAMVAPGTYHWVDGWDDEEQNIDPSITAYAVEAWDNGRSGEVILTTHQIQASPGWTLTGTANVWSVTTAFEPVKVVDLNYKTLRGSFYDYPDIASTANVSAVPGSCWIDGTTTYVHTLDGRDPSDGQICVLRDAYSGGEPNAVHNVYARGLTIVGGGGGLKFRNSSVAAAGRIVLKDCRALSCGGPGFNLDGVAEGYLENCVAIDCATDGFSYSANGSRIGAFMEVDCIGAYNRSSGGDTGNGSTSHAGTQVLRVAGRYYGNQGPQIADVNAGTASWNVGCFVGSSTSQTTGSQDSGFFANDSKMYLLDCVSRGAENELAAVGGDGEIYHDACSFATFDDSNGTIAAYRNG